MERRRFKEAQYLEERLAEEAKRLRAEAKLLPTRRADPQSAAGRNRLTHERVASLAGTSTADVAD